MAFTQSDIDALDAAIKAGVRKVKYDNEEVEYHSLAEMLRLRATMRNEVAVASGSKRTRVLTPRFSRGYQ